MGIIIKNKEQIQGIRLSSELAAQCLRFIEPYVMEGVTTAELDWRLEEYIRSFGAVPACKGYGYAGIPPFPCATCISVNEVVCHGVPGPYALKDGDILNIDVTTILDGYFGDTSRMYFVGNVSKEADQVMLAARLCLDAGIAQVYPGNRFGNIGHAVQQMARMMGCTVVHQFSGHGVGLKFHEEPQVDFTAAKDSGPVMKPGMIFTIEPMINLGVPDAVICEQDKWTARTADGKLSAQYEHTVLVTEDGYDILSKLAKVSEQYD